MQFASLKTVSNLETFLENYPNNQYKNWVIKDLFDLKSLEHTKEMYEKFLNDFPTYSDNEKSKMWLLSFAYQQKKLGEEIKKNSFTIDDYWRKLNEEYLFQMIPFLEDEKYGFLNENGKVIVPHSIDEIAKKYHCETIKTPYLLYYKNGIFGIGDKFGNIWHETQFDKVENLSDILLKVSKNTSTGVVHALTGKEILPLKYDMVEFLTPNLLKIRKNRRWGLAGMNGQIILEPTFSEIEALTNDFIVVQTEGQYLTWSIKDILNYYQEKKPLNQTKYNKIEYVSPNFIRVKNDIGENIMNKKGQILFTHFQEKIDFWEDAGFATLKQGKYQTYDTEGQKNSSVLFDKVLALPQRIIVKNGKKWGILMPNGRPYRDFDLDSVAVAGNLMVCWEGKKIWAEGKNQKIIDLTGTKNLRFEKPFVNFPDWFLAYNEANQKKNILSSTGQKLLSAGNFNNYSYLSPQFLSVSQGGKYGLVDSLGRIIIMPRYDGILTTDINQRKILSLGGKFGVIDKTSMIEPVFDQVPFPYQINNEMIGYFGKRNDLFGLMNGKGKNLVPFEFQNLIVWNDSCALVQNKKNEWLFYYFYKAKDKLVKSELRQVKVVNQNSTGVVDWTKDIYVMGEKYGYFGIWHGKKGVIVPPDFDQIINIGTNEKPFFFAERKSQDKKRFQVMYYNHLGSEIWSKVLSEDDYLRLVCE
ncbi:MAG: WG repeat-containing protein [Bacteroidetes bacterium]|nr:MAG: WG repeat-containing protein [Bacteroidota bacterium]